MMCKEVAKYQIKENEACVVSIKYNACLCADKFDINSWSEISKFRQEPLEYCDGIMGVQKEFAMKEIQPKFKALQRLKESTCRNQKSPPSKISSKSTTTQPVNPGDEYFSHSSELKILNSRESK